TSDDMLRPAAAISRLQTLAARHPGSMPVQMLAATVLRQYGRAQAAQDLAGRATQAFPQSPEPARLSYQLFAEAGNTSAALTYARMWRDRSGADTTEADAVIARLLLNRSETDAMLTHLAPYVQPERLNKPSPL